MAAIIYSLCALTAFICASLLLLAYHRSNYRLLLWGGLCFVGLTINNLFLIADKILFPLYDLSLWRLSTSFIAMSIMLYGLVWDRR